MQRKLSWPVATVIRLAKALLTLATGLYGAIVVFGNLTDYQTNYTFIRHVLTMDSTYPDNKIMYRSIESPRVHHALLRFIIFIEALITILCTKGGLDMLRHLESDPETFHESKRWGIGGMLLALLLWFFGFQGVAGEWFGMWMSKEWNGLPDAARLTQYISTTLVFVAMKNDD